MRFVFRANERISLSQPVLTLAAVLTHLSLSISCEVVHFCHVHQFDKITGQRWPDMSWSHKQSSSVLSLKITLDLQHKITDKSNSLQRSSLYLHSSLQAPTWSTRLCTQSGRSLRKTAEREHMLWVTRKSNKCSLWEKRAHECGFTWQPSAARRNVRMVGDTGAAPVIIILTCPPRLSCKVWGNQEELQWLKHTLEMLNSRRPLINNVPLTKPKNINKYRDVSFQVMPGPV